MLPRRRRPVSSSLEWAGSESTGCGAGPSGGEGPCEGGGSEGRGVGRGRAGRRLPEGERGSGSKMATTKRVLYVGEQARAPSRVLAYPIRVGLGIGPDAEGGE